MNVISFDDSAEKTPRGKIIRRRELRGKVGFLVGLFAISASLFHLYVAKFGVLEAMKMRSFHLAFLLPLAFLLYPATQRSPRDRVMVWDVVLSICSILASIHVGALAYERIITRYAYVDPLTSWDIIFGTAMILLVLEAARRVLGNPLVIVAIVALVYAYLGPYLPGPLAYAGASTNRILEHLYLTSEGIFGIPVGASATFIFLFVLFGAFLDGSGAGQFFIDFACGLTGGARGGPAKMAVLSSALMGTVSGSAAANVVATGSYTIPLMKSLNYEPHFAGAVETAASTGGQIMPPIMGAAAFILAEFTGIPYIKVCAAAAMPAIL